MVPAQRPAWLSLSAPEAVDSPEGTAEDGPWRNPGHTSAVPPGLIKLTPESDDWRFTNQELKAVPGR